MHIHKPLQTLQYYFKNRLKQSFYSVYVTTSVYCRLLYGTVWRKNGV